MQKIMFFRFPSLSRCNSVLKHDTKNETRFKCALIYGFIRVTRWNTPQHVLNHVIMGTTHQVGLVASVAVPLSCILLP